MIIKKGDNIIVLAGNDKGKRSKVLKAFPATGKILVEAVNMTKKHQRKRKEGGKGQIITVAMPMDASNVALFCSKCDRGTRTKSKIVNDKKLLVCVKCSSEF